MLEDFHLIIEGDPDSNYQTVKRADEKMLFTDANLDIVKMQAEIWAKKNGFNALLDYHVFTNDEGKVCLEGYPALVKLDYVDVTKKVAESALDAGLGVVRAAFGLFVKK